jgi:hypothetical protein
MPSGQRNITVFNLFFKSIRGTEANFFKNPFILFYPSIISSHFFITVSIEKATAVSFDFSEKRFQKFILMAAMVSPSKE